MRKDKTLAATLIAVLIAVLTAVLSWLESGDGSTAPTGPEDIQLQNGSPL